MCNFRTIDRYADAETWMVNIEVRLDERPPRVEQLLADSVMECERSVQYGQVSTGLDETSFGSVARPVHGNSNTSKPLFVKKRRESMATVSAVAAIPCCGRP
jgi:hypothetical protein